MADRILSIPRRRVTRKRHHQELTKDRRVSAVALTSALK